MIPTNLLSQKIVVFGILLSKFHFDLQKMTLGGTKRPCGKVFLNPVRKFDARIMEYLYRAVT